MFFPANRDNRRNKCKRHKTHTISVARRNERMARCVTINNCLILVLLPFHPFLRGNDRKEKWI